MTGINEHDNHSRSDDNLDRLLKLGEPAPRMPANLKSRIRSRLSEEGKESGIDSSHEKPPPTSGSPPLGRFPDRYERRAPRTAVLSARDDQRGPVAELVLKPSRAEDQR